VEEALYLLAAATIGAMWLRALRPRRGRGEPVFDESLEIAIHVGVHEAGARKQRVEPVHLLYGLLQDEQLRANASKVGADVDAIENDVFAALDDGEGIEAAGTPALSPVSARILDRTIVTAQTGSRLAGCADLFAYLIQVDPSTDQACRAGGVRAVDLLFVLVHGVAESDLPAPAAGEVAVILVNDDISTMELVVEALEGDFGLRTPDATELMLKVHREGRGVVGRFPAAEARQKANAATARARSRGYPLMVRLEA